MNSLIQYYIQIFTPIPFLYFGAKSGDSILFGILFFNYFLFRIFMDYFRLKNKGILSSKDFLTFPTWHFKYFRELYLE